MNGRCEPARMSERRSRKNHFQKEVGCRGEKLSR